MTNQDLIAKLERRKTLACANLKMAKELATDDNNPLYEQDYYFKRGYAQACKDLTELTKKSLAEN